MAENSVILAHEHATKAEQAYDARDFAVAVQYHQAASDMFLACKEQTPDVATLEALQLLADSQQA
eukprot:SAG11_NODE_7219_length_1176_cov_2.378830_1_plen_64_part_01